MISGHTDLVPAKHTGGPSDQWSQVIRVSFTHGYNNYYKLYKLRIQLCSMDQLKDRTALVLYTEQGDLLSSVSERGGGGGGERGRRGCVFCDMMIKEVYS